MGDVAEDMAKGLTCSHCGCAFESEHGYPVLCNICWSKSTTEERKGVQKAHIEELVR